MSTDTENPKTLDEIAAEAFDAVESGQEAPQAERLEFDEPEGGDQTVSDHADSPETTGVEGGDQNTDAEQDNGPVDTEVSDDNAEPELEDRAPSSWKKEVAEKWPDIPVEIKQEIQRRESDYHKGIEQYKQYAGIGHNVEKAIAPYIQTIQSAGVNPIDAISKLFHADHQLRYGSPEQKAQFLSKLAQDYDVPLDQVQSLPPVDPEIQALQQHNYQLQQFQQNVLNQQNQTVMSDIERFKSDPNNVHFNEVAGDMQILLQSNRAQSLEEAYEMAVWMRPDIRKSLVEQQRTEAGKMAANRARENRAKSASVGVKGSAPSKGGVLKPGADLRDVVAAAVSGDIQ